MKRSCCPPSDYKARPPLLSTVSLTPKTTPSTWILMYRPNWARVSYTTETQPDIICDSYWNSCWLHPLLSAVFHSYFSPPLVTLRYQKADGRFGTTSFNHASLADGGVHHVMLHASGLQHGPPRLNIYVDCRLAHTLDDLPAAFGSIPPGANRVSLKTMQSNGQVNSRITVQSMYVCV